MTEAYCVKDRQKVVPHKVEIVEIAGEKWALRGTCPKCGSKVFKLA